jgi:hypothetical protein
LAFPFLNSGTYAGRAKDLRRMLRRVKRDTMRHAQKWLLEDRIDDQRALYRYHLSRPDEAVIDAGALLFHTLHDVPPSALAPVRESESDHLVREGREEGRKAQRRGKTSDVKGAGVGDPGFRVGVLRSAITGSHPAVVHGNGATTAHRENFRAVLATARATGWLEGAPPLGERRGKGKHEL